MAYDRTHAADRELHRRYRRRGLGRLRQSGCALTPTNGARRVSAATRNLSGDFRHFNPSTTHSYHTISCPRLKASGSVRARAGWQPMHLLAEDAGGALLGAVPCYVKSHSRGEYVFDHGWAEAYERAGGSYYPKLQVAVPFTPATGRRLLVRPGPQADAVRAALADALVDVCRRSDASSVHVTFPTEPEWQLLGARGYLKRTHQQFHWENAGYDSLRRISRGARLAQAQRPSAASARTRSRTASACIG